ncbi:transporter [Aeoliella sp.]|uniref:transporter n=1 Tax=Aeoliella sp. TaxID=2795800 RepID=UPI003CCBDA10
MERHLTFNRGFVLAVVLFASPSACLGQLFEFCDDFTKPYCCQRDPFEERIETERHDFTQSAVTVGRGILQVEAGYSYFYHDTEEETESAHTTPELMLRWGITEDIEFRVRWNHVWVFAEDEDDRIGSEDIRYALKLQMTRQTCDGLLPTSALEVRGSAPTGGEAFTTGRAEFDIDYIYQWELREGLTIAGSTGIGSDGFGDFGLIPDEPTNEYFIMLTQSAVLGVELTEENTMYAEWYGIFSDGLADEFVISVFNIGIDHYINDDFVVDFRIGVGLSEDSDDFFTGVGGGYRF